MLTDSITTGDPHRVLETNEYQEADSDGSVIIFQCHLGRLLAFPEVGVFQAKHGC